MSKSESKPDLIRLTANISTGRGDSGESELISGYRISKSSVVASLQNYLQDLSIEICLWLTEYRDSLSELADTNQENNSLPDIVNKLTTLRLGLDQLDYFVDSISNNISSSIYFRLEKFGVEDSDIDNLIHAYSEITKQLEDYNEFFKFKGNKRLLRLERISVKVRQTEVEYTRLKKKLDETYSRKFKDVDSLSDHHPILNDEDNTATYLNRYSDFVLNFARLIAALEEQKPSYWKKENM